MPINHTSKTIQSAARLIHISRYAVCLTGAGISTPSGIPDFRSTSSGLWKENDPIQVASIFSFRREPEAFYNWFQPLGAAIAAANPNRAHKSLADLSSIGKLQAVITQNIDGLHQLSGSSNVIELHGNLRRFNCINCNSKALADKHIPRFLTENQIPRCHKCSQILKPDAVLFGEAIPAQAWQSAVDHVRRCDLLIIAGTSLEVGPANTLPAIAMKKNAPIIIINREPTMIDSMVDFAFRENIADVLPNIIEEVCRLETA